VGHTSLVSEEGSQVGLLGGVIFGESPHSSSVVSSPLFGEETQGAVSGGGDSLVVTDPTTNPALRSLTMGERTGSRIFYELWSYVLNTFVNGEYIYFKITREKGAEGETSRMLERMLGRED
jgi:hypothetical protein